jgi:hypothetical protein
LRFILHGALRRCPNEHLGPHLIVFSPARISALVHAFVVMVALAVAPALASPAKHPPDKKASPFDRPMEFVIVRSNAGYCEPNCPEWIYGEGQIVAATPAAFSRVLKQAGARRLPLVLMSPGGNVDAAIEIGRLVRERKMDVQVGFTRLDGCAAGAACTDDAKPGREARGMVVVAGAFCWSACPLILAGGERRLSPQWASTGVHQVTTVYQREKVYYREKYRIVNGKKKVISRKIISRKKAGTKSTTKLPKATRTLLTSYFQDMGIDRSLLTAMLSTAPDKIRRLEPAEMMAMRLITEESTHDMVGSPMQCSQDSRPVNCIFRDGRPDARVGGQPAPAPN